MKTVMMVLGPEHLLIGIELLVPYVKSRSEDQRGITTLQTSVATL